MGEAEGADARRGLSREGRMPRGKSVRGVRGTKSGGGPRQKKGQDAVKQNRAGKTVNISAKPRHVQVRQPNPQDGQMTGNRARHALACRYPGGFS